MLIYLIVISIARVVEANANFLPKLLASLNVIIVNDFSFRISYYLNHHEELNKLYCELLSKRVISNLFSNIYDTNEVLQICNKHMQLYLILCTQY